MGQTRFTTVATASEVIRQLILKDELQATEGKTFELKLVVPTYYADAIDWGTITLIVDRNNKVKADYTFKNGDDIFVTNARLEPGGKSFRIDITMPFRSNSIDSASVTVPDEFYRLMLELHPQDDDEQ